MAATAAPSVLRRAFQAFSLTSPPLHTCANLFIHGTPVSSLPIRRSALRLCHLAQATKGEVDILLKGVEDKNVIEEVKRIHDMARRASARRQVLHTDFLTPPTLKESLLLLEKIADVKAVAQGGYPQAERCRISIGHPEVLTDDPDIVAALREKKELKSLLFLSLLTFLSRLWTRLVMYQFLVQVSRANLVGDRSTADDGSERRNVNMTLKRNQLKKNRWGQVWADVCSSK